MGRGELGVVKGRELRHKREPSLWGGRWGGDVMSGVRFNEERNKQDKTGPFIHNSGKIMLTDSLEDIQKWENEQLESRRNQGRLCMRAPSENIVFWTHLMFSVSFNKIVQFAIFHSISILA